MTVSYGIEKRREKSVNIFENACESNDINAEIKEVP